jgi:hypothetical protein
MQGSRKNMRVNTQNLAFQVLLFCMRQFHKECSGTAGLSQQICHQITTGLFWRTSTTATNWRIWTQSATYTVEFSLTDVNRTVQTSGHTVHRTATKTW